MSGHSKWSQIKRQKGTADAKRGQVFTKLTREIIVAARQGGASPEANFRLRLAIQRARDHNMPLENIERAIKKGSGEMGEGASLVEMNLEGYGPHGIAILLQALTDNRNRTLQEIRSVFSRGGASLGESGCVLWLFDPKGVITIESEGAEAEELALYAIDAGAEDVKTEKGYVEIQTNPEDLDAVRKAIKQRGVSTASAELLMVPKTTVPLDDNAALQTLKLLDKLEELDDVQRVFSNADFSDAALEQYRSQT
jgi:YebC/PmpR family DNA-binding regulatory protein